MCLNLIDALRTQFSLEIAVGVVSVQRDGVGIRRSYYEAVFASTYPDSWGSLCRFEDLQLSSNHDGWQSGDKYDRGNPAGGAYVEFAIERIRKEWEQQTWNAVDQATAYIRDRFHEELSLEEVAKHVHLNAHYFSKVFKRYYADDPQGSEGFCHHNRTYRML